jgi:hypothetical protein
MSHDSHFYADPKFYDDSIMVECDRCDTEYDERDYNSTTCSQCEDYEVEMEKRKMPKYETAQALANALWRLLPEVSDTDAIYDAVAYLEEMAKATA